MKTFLEPSHVLNNNVLRCERSIALQKTCRRSSFQDITLKYLQNCQWYMNFTGQDLIKRSFRPKHFFDVEQKKTTEKLAKGNKKNILITDWRNTGENCLNWFVCCWRSCCTKGLCKRDNWLFWRLERLLFCKFCKCCWRVVFCCKLFGWIGFCCNVCDKRPVCGFEFCKVVRNLALGWWKEEVPDDVLANVGGAGDIMSVGLVSILFGAGMFNGLVFDVWGEGEERPGGAEFGGSSLSWQMSLSVWVPRSKCWRRILWKKKKKMKKVGLETKNYENVYTSMLSMDGQFIECSQRLLNQNKKNCDHKVSKVRKLKIFF